MHWLNLNIPTMIRSPEYVGSSPAERGTWLSVLAYACTIECGGVLVGAAVWKDRQWQQACGVTSREVRAAGRLLRVVGLDVHVNGYPEQKERQVRMNRKNASAGAMARWGKAGGNAETMPGGIADPMPGPDAEGEGERKEKGKGEGERATPAPPVFSEGKAGQPEAEKLDVRNISAVLTELVLANDYRASFEWAAACDQAGCKDEADDADFLRWAILRLRREMNIRYARELPQSMLTAWSQWGRAEYKRLQAKAAAGVPA